MKDLIDGFHSIGVPTWVILTVFVVYVIAKEFRVLEKPAQKTERELLSADQLTFRRDILTRVSTAEARADLAEKNSAEMSGKLTACERRHDEVERRFELEIAEVRNELAECEARHDSLLRLYEKTVEEFTGKMAGLVSAIQARGIDLLFDMGAVMPMPEHSDALLTGIDNRMKDRRKVSVPVGNDRRKGDRRKSEGGQ